LRQALQLCRIARRWLADGADADVSRLALDSIATTHNLLDVVRRVEMLNGALRRRQTRCGPA
jgi:hypothetical protein